MALFLLIKIVKFLFMVRLLFWSYIRMIWPTAIKSRLNNKEDTWKCVRGSNKHALFRSFFKDWKILRKITTASVGRDQLRVTSHKKNDLKNILKIDWQNKKSNQLKIFTLFVSFISKSILLTIITFIKNEILDENVFRPQIETFCLILSRFCE